jgi:hypothetical protein
LAKQKLPAWFSELDLEATLLCWLCRCQQRHESAAIGKFGDKWSAVEIRSALRELQSQKAIMLMGFDRVTWAIEMRGRNRAARARDRAKAALARKAAA